jgi:hypothetical protein
MLPFDYCCSSVKKELKKRICKVCNQYIPSAYRMKNHYKIHAQHYGDLDHDQDDTLTQLLSSTNDATTTNSNENQASIAPPVVKTEMLDWLRSDFDEFDLGPQATQLASDRVTRSMKKLRVQEKKEVDDDDEEKNKDWLHIE